MAYPAKIVSDRVLSYHDASFTELDPHIAATANGEISIFATVGSGTDVDIGSDHGANSLQSGFSATPGFLVGFGPDGIHQTQASAYGLREGGLAVAWTSTPDNTSDADILASVVGSDGNLITRTPIIVASGASQQVRPEVVEAAGGNLAFAWIDLTANQIKAAVFTKSGSSVAFDTVSTTPANNSSATQDLGMTALANGDFVVSWLDNSGHDHFRIMDSTGPAFTTGQIDLPGNGSTDVAALADGRFVATYFRGPVFSGGHFAEIFNSDGSLSVPEFRLSSSNGFQAVAALPDDRFMIVYDTFGDIFGRIWNPDGSPSSPEFLVSSDTSATQSHPHLDTLVDGTVAVAWEDTRTGNGDIYYTVLDPRQSGVHISGTANDDLYTGSPFADVIDGGDGNDNIEGGAGNDTLFGGRGNDFLYGNAGNDVLDGGPGFNDLFGGDGDDLFVVTPTGSGNVIVDFQAGPGSLDRIDLRPLGNVHAIGDVLAHATQNGADTFLDFGGGNTLDLIGISLGTLSPDDFLFTQYNSAGGWTPAGDGSQGWYVGDFTGDGRDDILRYSPGVSGAEVFNSTGSSFAGGTSWTGAGNDAQGWYIGDFNGDGRTDIFRFHEGVSGAEVFTSTGSSFTGGASWTGAGNNGRWYVGDFDGDGRDDVFRYHEGFSGAEVFTSTGSSFTGGASWTGASNGTQGWYVGDFDGDGRSDIMRYNPGVSGAEVFLSNGSSFVPSGSWTGAGNEGQWYVGDFNGDGRDDIARTVTGTSGFDVFLSNGGAFVHSGSWTTQQGLWHVGDFNADGSADIFRVQNGVTGADVFLA